MVEGFRKGEDDLDQKTLYKVKKDWVKSAKRVYFNKKNNEY